MFQVVNIDENQIYVQVGQDIHPVPRTAVPFPVQVGDFLDIYQQEDGTLLVQASKKDDKRRLYMILAGVLGGLLLILATFFFFGQGQNKQESSTISVNQSSSSTSKSKSSTSKSSSKESSSSSSSAASSSQASSSTGGAAVDKQVRVQVKDLRIRAAASIQSADKGFIAPGTYQIVEELTADGYTWGKLADGRGWIALQFTTPADGTPAPAPASQASGSGMDLDAIAAGNYSSIAGTWRNGKGYVMTFDANGLVGHQFFTGIVKKDDMGIAAMYGANDGAVQFIPAGVSIAKFSGDANIDPTDSNKDRIHIGQAVVTDSADYYYRVN